MNDITALAQKEKFEAWAHSQKLSLAYGDCGYAFSSTEMAWRAWMASSYALVEALEARDKQIAELEREKVALESVAQAMRDDMRKSRTVTVKLPKLLVLGSNAEWYQGYAAGTSSMRKDCATALRAAGIQVIEGEQKNG